MRSSSTVAGRRPLGSAGPQARSDDGQSAAGYLGVVIALLLTAATLLPAGVASLLRSQAQTAADAAALAGAEEIRRQLDRHFNVNGSSGVPRALNAASIQAEAQAYAARNDAVLEAIDLEGLTVTVRVRQGDADAFATAPAGTDLDGKQAVATASATVNWYYAGNDQIVEAPRGTSGNPGDCPLSGVEVERAADLAGVPRSFALNGSVLTRYRGCDGDRGGPSVKGLREEMRAAILRAEWFMAGRDENPGTGQPLLIANGFRSSAFQERLCPQVEGPCATPGRSRHQFGLAVDVINYQALAAVIGAAGVPLCQTVMPDDPVHFVYQYGGGCSDGSGGRGYDSDPYIFEVYLVS